jgi:hypothetical protein
MCEFAVRTPETIIVATLQTAVTVHDNDNRDRGK